MANQEISQFTNGNVPAVGDFVAGYAAASAGVAGGNRRWSCTNLATRISAILGLGTMSTQDADSVAITGGAVDGAVIGGDTPAEGSFTDINYSGQITSSIANGTAPLIVTSSTRVTNLNVETCGLSDASNAVASNNESSDATCFVAFFTGSGIQLSPLKTNPVFGYNSVTNTLSANITAPGAGVTMAAATGTVILKQGANGKTGTVTLNGITPVTVTNSSITANSGITFTLKTVGGTVGAYPAIQTITPGVGFTVAGTALDLSTYNIHIVESAA